MTTVNDITTLGGLLKRVYSDDIVNLIPNNSYLTELIPFEKTKQIGESFVTPVQLSNEQGITYIGNNSSNTTLMNSVPGNIKQAIVSSNQIIGTANINYDVISRAKQANSASSFRNAMDTTMKSLVLSLRKRLEINLLYGGTSVGTTMAGTTGTAIVLTAASFSSYIWSAAENMLIDIYSSAGVYKGTTIVSSADTATRTLTVTDSGMAGTSADLIYIAGTKGNESLGIHPILTTSGSLFGIDNTSYSLWKGNSFAVGGALTQAKVDQALTYMVEKGFSGEAVLLTTPRSWSDLNQEQASRIGLAYNGEFIKGADLGTNKITFHSQTGNKVTVVPHPLCMNGNAYIIDKSTFKRIGSCDVELGSPVPGSSPIIELPGNAACRVLAYSNQALFCERPANNCVLTGITTF